MFLNIIKVQQLNFSLLIKIAQISNEFFSIVWSVGATLDGNGRIAFDKFLRNLISGMNDAFPRPKSIKISKQTNFPDRGSIYDFLFVKTGNGSWEDLGRLGKFGREKRFVLSTIEIFFISLNSDFPASMGLREMIIPNANTIQQNYFLKTLSLDHQLPLLFVGPTGT